MRILRLCSLVRGSRGIDEVVKRDGEGGKLEWVPWGARGERVCRDGVYVLSRRSENAEVSNKAASVLPPTQPTNSTDPHKVTTMGRSFAS
jgi:hypothetical protein